MPDISMLHELIKDTAKQALVDSYGKKQAILTEPQCPGVSVTISGLPDNVIVIKADAFTSPDTVFIGANGECKRADFVIIANTGNKKVVLCIEMKATKGSEKEIIQQLTGAQCFVSYCREIGKAFWNQPDFLKSYVYRFVSISQISIAKSKTRMTRSTDSHDRPEQMLKIAYPHHLQFNHLIGGR
jgi:hypothetical protein